ncbi:FMN-binding split barrel [Xylariaceae sp. FL0594]|nr:FMN-binding split barrel [Xylariaceae sp. FL0594]
MSPHPDFKTVEASRPDWDTSSSFHLTKAADPNWTYGSGANHLRDEAEEGKAHVKIDPHEAGRPAPFNYKLLISAITPRPIGFISSRSGTGTDGPTAKETFNLAPFSYFNVINTDPPLFAVGISSSLSSSDKPAKDTLRNLAATRECTVSIISEHFLEAANATSIDSPPDVSEWDISGLTPLFDCETVSTPRVREAVFTVECVVESIREFDSRAKPGTKSGSLVVLEGTRFWVREDAINDERNMVNTDVLKPVSRLGGISYGRTVQGVELPRPVFGKEVGREGVEELKKNKEGGNGKTEARLS